MLFLNCQKNTELLSQTQDRPATLREKWAMRAHLLMCRGCRNFDRQLAFMRKAAHELLRKL